MGGRPSKGTPADKRLAANQATGRRTSTASSRPTAGTPRPTLMPEVRKPG